MAEELCDYMAGGVWLTGPCSLSSPCPGPQAAPEKHNELCWWRSNTQPPPPRSHSCRGGNACPIHRTN